MLFKLWHVKFYIYNATWKAILIPTHNKWQFWTFKKSNNNYYNYFGTFVVPHFNNKKSIHANFGPSKDADLRDNIVTYYS